MVEIKNNIKVITKFKGSISSSGILSYKTMADKFMYIPDVYRIIPSVDWYQWLKCMDSQLNELTNINLTKVPIVVRLKNKKSLL